MRASRPSPASRLAWAAALPIALTLVFFLGRETFAALYLSFSEQQLAIAHEGEASQRGADLARSLAPWKPEAHSAYARNRAADADLSAAIPAFAQALRWAPADAHLWREMLRSLVRAGRFDQLTFLALDQTRKLAPHSPGIQLGNALDGVYFWRHGDEAFRAAWLDAMRYSLFHSRNLFLFQVARAHRELYFCAYAGASLHQQKWCQQAFWLRSTCAQPDLPKPKRIVCRNTGFNVRPQRP
jgi:hypothetical protein